MVGTRPEAIKLALVAAALAQAGLSPRLLSTGHHPPDAAEHGLCDHDRVTIDGPGRRNPLAMPMPWGRQLSECLTDPPALLVVQGDTSSALGGPLAGFAASVPITHLEAGLATGNRERVSRRRCWSGSRNSRRVLERRAEIDAGASVDHRAALPHGPFV